MPDAMVSVFEDIPSGIAGTRATLKKMVSVVREFCKPPSGDTGKAGKLLRVRNLAVVLVRSAREKDYWKEAELLQCFVRDSIRYVQDLEHAETLQYPDVTLELQSGDCDDKSMLLASLARCVGFPARFCAIAIRDEPEFSHVSAQLLIPRAGWVNCETIPVPGKAPIGWFPPDATQTMLAHV